MSRFRARAAGMTVGIVAALLAPVLLSSSPAFAHDELVQSSPTVGEVFDVSPTSVTLDFSDDVLTMGAIVVVVDENGRDWVADDLVLAGTRVEAAIEPNMPAAGYEVRWRVVSSDGHPISGVIPFTVGDGKPFERDTTTTGAAQPEPTESSAQSQNAQTDDPFRLVLIGGGGAIAAVAVFALITLFRRRTRSDDLGAP